MHPDIVKVYGTDKQRLLQHFCEYGMKEGRQDCAGFNVSAYKSKYKDPRKAFGDDLPTYYKHFCIQGKNVRHNQDMKKAI